MICGWDKTVRLRQIIRFALFLTRLHLYRAQQSSTSTPTDPVSKAIYSQLVPVAHSRMVCSTKGTSGT